MAKKKIDIDNAKTLVLKKTATKSTFNTTEATEILKLYGLASSEQSVQKYIRDKKLNAKPTISEKTGEVDKRLGYQISEASLYSFIVKRIPATETLWKELENKGKAQKENS